MGPLAKAARLDGLARAFENQSAQESNPEVAHRTRRWRRRWGGGEGARGDGGAPEPSVPMTPDVGPPNLAYPGSPGGSPLPGQTRGLPQPPPGSGEQP